MFGDEVKVFATFAQTVGKPNCYLPQHRKISKLES